MKAVKSTFTLLAALAVAAPIVAQPDREELARLDREIAVMEAALARLRPDLAALERAMQTPETVTWMTAQGWRSAATADLVNEVAFLQMAAARPEARDRTERIAGMELPPALAETAMQRTEKNAQRLVRDWIDSEGAKNQKEVAAHAQGLKRTVKMAESWLAEHRSVRQAATQPSGQPGAYPQGPCHVPAGRWDVDSNREVLEVTSDYMVIARKTKGSRNVPAGKIAFYLQPRSCDAGVQTAEEGFVNPTWERSRITLRWLEPGKRFAIDWPQGGTVTYTRVE